jgi:hypothetical protein
MSMYFQSNCFVTDVTVIPRPYIVFDIISAKEYEIKNNFNFYRSISTVFIPTPEDVIVIEHVGCTSCCVLPVQRLQLLQLEARTNVELNNVRVEEQIDKTTDNITGRLSQTNVSVFVYSRSLNYYFCSIIYTRLVRASAMYID